MPGVPLTALVHTLNEADQIVDCLRSVDWADETYLIDSYSTDGTVELVKKLFPRTRIEQRKFLGSASQKNYGMDHASHDWILVLDADERVTPELRHEIESLLARTPPLWAYSVGRRNLILGKEVRWSLLRRDRVTRFFHRRHARYENRRVHASLMVDGEAGRLKGKLLHYNVRSFDHSVEKLSRFALWSAAQLFLEGRKVSAAGIFGCTLIRLMRDYFLHLGFLHGTRGLITVGMQGFYTFWKYAKLWELNELKRAGKAVPLPEMDLAEERWRKPWEVPPGRSEPSRTMSVPNSESPGAESPLPASGVPRAILEQRRNGGARG